MSFAFDGYLKDSSALKALEVKISDPTTNADGSFCVVRLSPVLNGDKKIYGIDKEQAAQLAAGFVRTILEGHDIVNDQGQPLALSL